MKRYFCEKCSGILPKRKIVCDKCGYENPELIPVLRERVKRQIIIRRAARIAAVVALVLILNANMLLFPWQWGAFDNKMTMLSYIKENYPGAKIVSQKYETTKMIKIGTFMDIITVEWNGVEFNVSTDNHGSPVYDSYWDCVGEKLVYEKCLKPFFDERDIVFRFDIYSLDGLDDFVREKPDGDISGFDGHLSITIFPEYISGKIHPRDLGWVYDFYRYWKNETGLKNYDVRIIYPDHSEGRYLLEFTDESSFASAEKFYSSAKPNY